MSSARLQGPETVFKGLPEIKTALQPESPSRLALESTPRSPARSPPILPLLHLGPVGLALVGELFCPPETQITKALSLGSDKEQYRGGGGGT